MPQPTSPSDHYRQRLQARELRVRHLETIHIRLGYLRLLLAAALAALVWIYLAGHTLSALWLGVPVLLFIAVAAFHAKLLARQALAQRAVDFYRHGLARIEDKWQGTGARGERFDVSEHLYASDLDLFGHGSLFQLLSAARTLMGEDTLADWLLRPSSLDAIRQRHQAIPDLRDRIDFREAMAVSGESLEAAVHPDQLTAWAQSPLQLPSQIIRWFSLFLSILMVATAVYWSFTGLRYPFFLVLLLEGSVVATHRARVNTVLHQTEHALADLKLISSLLAHIEAEDFKTPYLQELKNSLATRQVTASKAISRLDTIGQYIQSLENPLMRLIDIPLLYSVQVAFAADSWRRQFGAAVPAWLSELGQMEALLSLTTYSFEHPEDPLPTFVSGPPCFQARNIGHPLIPASRCVRNNLSLDSEQRVVLVSGSNMSGKSTLMRSVGINTVLAMAGAPVRAQSLQLTPLHIGASILINDSLQKGASRFYAEITRLRHILDLATGHPPLLFLLDELLQGTNSRDRLIGAEGILRALLETNAIGLISTHDLALTALRSDFLHNMHFQDQIDDGKMKFDYILRSGPVTRSNGVELMRLIGLNV
ncbi:mismatch repair protein [Edaphobacter sp. 12200R-103]|uniref:MutS-related protein n=1 Tax=Edaphobacter sp. 12200R-103 TaxID=2703788 RepID=UPI00138C5DEA|nr:mismatch repair protein [Edaphobacter sp. 12200R-103]QHS51776.1 mismatch repair protein [Edaphobacter sp. 12200R-103]